MSTTVNDFPRQVQLTASRFLDALEVTQAGAAVDLLQADGVCFAVQVISTVTGSEPSLSGKLQESDDNVIWSDIPTAVFSTISTGSNIQVLSFVRSKRYVRHHATVSGSGVSIGTSVLIGQQLKLT